MANMLYCRVSETAALINRADNKKLLSDLALLTARSLSFIWLRTHHLLASLLSLITRSAEPGKALICEGEEDSAPEHLSSEDSLANMYVVDDMINTNTHARTHARGVELVKSIQISFSLEREVEGCVVGILGSITNKVVGSSRDIVGRQLSAQTEAGLLL